MDYIYLLGGICMGCLSRLSKKNTLGLGKGKANSFNFSNFSFVKKTKGKSKKMKTRKKQNYLIHEQFNK